MLILLYNIQKHGINDNSNTKGGEDHKLKVTSKGCPSVLISKIFKLPPIHALTHIGSGLLGGVFDDVLIVFL